MSEEFNLSDWIEKDIDKIDVIGVKEFIKRQIERIDARILELSEFDGLAEVMLQKAELYKVKLDLINDAGKQLI